MTIRNHNSRVTGWRCEHPGCHKAGSGYASESAAARAEQHHNEQARHTTTGGSR